MELDTYLVFVYSVKLKNVSNIRINVCTLDFFFRQFVLKYLLTYSVYLLCNV